MRYAKLIYVENIDQSNEKDIPFGLACVYTDQRGTPVKIRITTIFKDSPKFDAVEKCRKLILGKTYSIYALGDIVVYYEIIPNYEYEHIYNEHNPPPKIDSKPRRYFTGYIRNTPCLKGVLYQDGNVQVLWASNKGWTGEQFMSIAYMFNYLPGINRIEIED